MFWRWVAAAAALVALAGCGATTAKAPARVTEAQAQVALDQQAIAHGALECTRSEPGAQVPAAVADLIKAFRREPRADSDGESMHAVLAKAAEQVEGCWPTEAMRLRNVLTYG